jgi:thiosulfate dehydrogenase [quinone] large subunit
MNRINGSEKYKVFGLAALRIIIGWHFLYEGLVKATNPNWSSVGYLLDSAGFMSGIFKWMAANATLLRVVDIMNVWGLIAIGLGLILGAFSRVALSAGITMLAMYYLSHPPFAGLKYELPMEGSYLFVNKNLIELVAMIILLLFPAHSRIGLDRLFFKKERRGNGK